MQQTFMAFPGQPKGLSSKQRKAMEPRSDSRPRSRKALLDSLQQKATTWMGIGWSEILEHH